MADEILTGSITAPYFVHDGDTVTLTEGAVLNGENIAGFENQQVQDNQINLTVEGQIRIYKTLGGTSPTGIKFDSNGARNIIRVEDTGSIRAETAIKLSGSATYLVENHGVLYGDYEALDLHNSPNAEVINTGRISGNIAASVFSTDNLEFTNTGLIDTRLGIYSWYSSGLSITNTGKIVHGSQAFIANLVTDSTFVNDGLVLVNSMFASIGSDSQGIEIENLGRVKSRAGVAVSESQVEFVNEGSLTTWESAFALSGSRAQLSVTNSGTIQSEGVAVAHYEGILTLENSGIIYGDIVGYDGIAEITNSGDIVGSIQFGSGDDTYTGSATGHVSGTIDGGAGRDILIGADGADDLSGGDGDDALQGNDGRDILDGGLGDDTLTGGQDRDTFVFAPEFGHDTIIDFENNFDSLVLYEAIWGGGKTAAQVLNQYAEIVSGSVVLDFADAGQITFSGFGTIETLANDIILV